MSSTGGIFIIRTIIFGSELSLSASPASNELHPLGPNQKSKKHQLRAQNNSFIPLRQVIS